MNSEQLVPFVAGILSKCSRPATVCPPSLWVATLSVCHLHTRATPSDTSECSSCHQRLETPYLTCPSCRLDDGVKASHLSLRCQGRDEAGRAASTLYLGWFYEWHWASLSAETVAVMWEYARSSSSVRTGPTIGSDSPSPMGQIWDFLR